VLAAATSYTVTDMGSLGLGESSGYGINATGLSYLSTTYKYSCGYPVTTCTAHPYHAFLSSNGTMTDLGTLGGHDSQGNAVNLSGPVAGWADTSKGAINATVWTGKKSFDVGGLAPIAGSYSVPAGDPDQLRHRDQQQRPDRPQRLRRHHRPGRVAADPGLTPSTPRVNPRNRPEWLTCAPLAAPTIRPHSSAYPALGYEGTGGPGSRLVISVAFQPARAARRRWELRRRRRRLLRAVHGPGQDTALDQIRRVLQTGGQWDTPFRHRHSQLLPG
jgi:hypothetical protein